MFRYVAFVWEPAQPMQAERVRVLTTAAYGSSPDWRVVFDVAGLRVVCAGQREGATGVLPLHERSGVVLGTLFTRFGEASTPHRVSAFRHDESRCIAATRGRALADSYWGRYVAFLRDADDGSVRIIRDPVGDIDCLESRVCGVKVFFSSLSDCELLSRMAPTINWDYVSASLSFPMLDQRETGLREISRVLAGECLELRERQTSRRFYWSPATHVRSAEILDPVIAARRIRHTARACAHAWASCYPSILLKLSGGLDSSVLLGLLANAPTTPEILCANLYCPGDPNSDEREYARISAGRAGKALMVYGPEAAFDARRLLAMPPFHSPSNLLPVVACNEPAWNIARRGGIPATFTGVGGDQLFFVAGSTYACSDAIFRHGLGQRAIAAAMGAARNRKMSVWQVLTEGARYAWTRDRARRLFGLYVPPDFMERDAAALVMQKRQFLHPWLSGTDDLAPGKVMHMLNLADTLGMCGTAPFCAADDPDYVHPLFSQPLKELCLQIPVPVLAVGGRSRALARMAFADEIAPEIRRRRDKGGPQQYIRNLVAKNLDLMREVVLDGSLVKERIVNRARAERLLGSGLVKEPRAAPYACHLFSAEAWLSGWRATRSSAVAA